MTNQVIALRGGWQAIVSPSEKDGENDITIRNTTNGVDRWFNITTKNSQHGAPLVIQEPSLSIPGRECGLDTDQNIVGAVVLGNDGDEIQRYSWSNLHFKGIPFHISDDGELFVEGESKGYMQFSLWPDKNRMKGVVAVFNQQRPLRKPFIVEMELQASMLFKYLIDRQE